MVRGGFIGTLTTSLRYIGMLLNCCNCNHISAGGLMQLYRNKTDHIDLTVGAVLGLFFHSAGLYVRNWTYNLAARAHG